MKKIILFLSVWFAIACESEKIQYHCNISSTQDVITDNSILDAGDVLDLDAIGFIHTKSFQDIGTIDEFASDSGYRDAEGRDTNSEDVITGRVCSKIGVGSECAIDESCYPFIECGGICRKCGSISAGSNCEIHSDCKCQMACLSLYDKQLRCYKVCNDSSDCPAGQTCTDGWGILYEHEYYKICMGTTVTKSKEEGK